MLEKQVLSNEILLSQNGKCYFSELIQAMAIELDHDTSAGRDLISASQVFRKIIAKDSASTLAVYVVWSNVSQKRMMVYGLYTLEGVNDFLY